MTAALQCQTFCWKWDFSIGLLTRTRHRDATFQTRANEITNLLNGNQGAATFLNGTMALVGFVSAFVFEECLESALR